MNRKLLIIAFLFCLFLSSRLQAQEMEEKTSQYAVSVEPAYLSNGGLRLNLEKKCRPNDRIELNLTGYLLSHRDMQAISTKWWDNNGGYRISNTDFEWISGLKGLGIGSAYKYYMGSFVIQPAVSYTWYNVEYPEYGFHRYEEYGLPFYDYAIGYKNKSFHKLTGNICMGARSSFTDLFFVEYYFGAGVAYSIYDSNQWNFNETMFGYGYSGIYFTMGLKFGIQWKKQ